MGKRHKRDYDEEIIRLKIKKLEDRLRTRNSRKTPSDVESASAWAALDSDHESTEILREVNIEPGSPIDIDTPDINILPSDTDAPLVAGTPEVTDTPADSVEVQEEPLDDEILTILGDAPKEESPVGPDLHKDVAARLRDIIYNGLKKEQKDKIKEDYYAPGNCQFLKAPVLNPEVRAAVSETVQKRDASIEARQGQIGTALAALGKAINMLVQDKNSDPILLKHLSNANKLICDSHYNDTKLRRNFLLSSLNNKLKETIKETKRSKFLFGDDLAETLKATKAITRSSQDLKSLQYRAKMGANKVQPSTSNNLNYKHPQPGYLHKKPAYYNHRAAGWTPTHNPHQNLKNQVTPRSQPTNARGTARYGFKGNRRPT